MHSRVKTIFIEGLVTALTILPKKARCPYPKSGPYYNIWWYGYKKGRENMSLIKPYLLRFNDEEYDVINFYKVE